MLVVLRGNSGSGKSTVARALQKALGGETAVLEQDHLRRVVYAELERGSLAHVVMLEAAATSALDAGHHVVVEGIFSAARYSAVLERIASRSSDARFFAFDLDFEETVRRHALRAKASSFTTDDMRSWYHGWQPLPFVEEQRIVAGESVADIVGRILRQT